MLKAKITKLNHEGRGITHIEGKIVFVDGALPEEEVVVRYTRKHPRFNEAVVEEILTSSPFRVTPGCAHFAICGGCHLQHMAAEQQIALKQQTLAEHFAHFGGLAPKTWLSPLQGPLWHYRDKARLSAKYVEKKQRFLLGFHEKGGRFVADLTNCPVLHAKTDALLTPLRELLSTLSIYRQLPQVEIAAAENDQLALIIRHMAPLSMEDKTKLQQFAAQQRIEIYLQPNKPEKIWRLYPENSEKPEKLTYTLPAYGLTLSFAPWQFTQINATINRAMIAQALNLLELTATDNVLDLFCGIGNFTLPMATQAATVIGVEGEREAVEQAKINAAANQLQNVAFHMANLFTPNKEDPWLQQSYDKILLDPPRTGALEILAYIPQWQPQRIVYVSCNPATLARDAGELVNRYGYQLISAGVMDMFPHTRHVESMALFVR